MRQVKKLPLDDLAPACLELPADRAAPLDWLAVFGNGQPVELEIGFGKGAFLVTAAAAHPAVNYLGIEVLRGLQLYAASRLVRRGLGNVRVACADARRVLATLVPAGSVQAVHVYFPDPWWKTRHHKRRVVTPAFAADCARAIEPGGRLEIASDVPETFAFMRESIATVPAFALESERAESGPPRPGEVLTNFERKARQKGGGVWRATYRRV